MSYVAFNFEISNGCTYIEKLWMQYASVLYVLLLFEDHAARQMCECLIFSFAGSYGISYS